MRVISTLVVSFCTHHITYDPFTFVSQFFSRWYSGHGDMAVSNAIGSNVFDILMCLGLPWFMKTAIVDPGSVVKVKSRGNHSALLIQIVIIKINGIFFNESIPIVIIYFSGLLYSTFSLFSTVVFLIVACHFNHWKLDRKFGVILLIWYFIFMSIAAMYELNVFGEYNTQCYHPSVYDWR